MRDGFKKFNTTLREKNTIFWGAVSFNPITSTLLGQSMVVNILPLPDFTMQCDVNWIPFERCHSICSLRSFKGLHQYKAAGRRMRKLRGLMSWTQKQSQREPILLQFPVWQSKGEGSLSLWSPSCQCKEYLNEIFPSTFHPAFKDSLSLEKNYRRWPWFRDLEHHCQFLLVAVL